MSLTCPVCGSQTALEGRTSEAELWRCPVCDHCFSDKDKLSASEEYSEEYYDKTHRNWFENPNRPLFDSISSFIAEKRPQASVLDIGCGNGNLLKHLLKNNHCTSLTGIDITPNQPVDGITFIQGDALATDFGRQFDIVTTLAVIEHVWDIKMFMKRLYELCAPSGFAVIMTLNDRSVLYGVARLLNAFGYNSPYERVYDKHHVHHFNVSSLRRLIETSGFDVRNVFLHNAPMRSVDFPASSALSAAVLRTGVWGTFALGNLTGKTYLQTMFCQKI
ncbi:MAG: class I SAM-dependent methyltransferase [Nitrospirae bacterium]|nr:class I SAM-dependent methyltransferase [Nitrospirota bacterium]